MTTLNLLRPSFALLALGLCGAFMPVAPPSVPSNFKVVADPARNGVTMSWSSSASQIRFFVQKQLPNGTWTAVSGFPVNHLNAGSFYCDTPSTQVGVFRFSLKAKQGTSYSAQTPWITRSNLH